MKNKLLKIKIISICSAILLFVLLLNSPGFNMIPFVIHERNLAFDVYGENEFIAIFDGLFSAVCGYLLFLLLRKIHIVDKR